MENYEDKNQETEVQQGEFKRYEDLPICMTINDLAKVMRIGKNLALELVHSKGFPMIRVGRRIVIPKDRFIEWLNSDNQSINSKREIKT